MHLCLQTFVHLLQYAGCYFQCNFAVRRGKKNENRICNTLKHDNHCTNDLTSTENGNSFFVSFTRSPETWHPKNIYFLQMFCFFLRFFWLGIKYTNHFLLPINLKNMVCRIVYTVAPSILHLFVTNFPIFDTEKKNTKIYCISYNMAV